eukprot:CAMPEP_0119291432 /NCGR_PEP_ID=MMETSP1329-20130426/42453_1 /TAXON_ID=114041 /ORGANISM="Genus nov. species nov., Strain RCC1024" /LENGTH=219 /DNA_ID=CAMNT_0007292259 /DNA_START=231 /DNA_END=888 /DNA_ORIENTATION=+
MVDPKATTRTEVPIDGNDSDSSGHDTDSSEGPHTPTPRDPPSEDELDYEDPADEVEQEVFQKEYRISVEEYTRLRKAYASMAVSTTSDSELAALKADIEKSKRVMKEFRAILQEHPATRKPSRRRDCKHETRRSDRGERRSWVLTSAVTLPSKVDVACQPHGSEQVSERGHISYDIASLMAILGEAGVDTSMAMFEDICTQVSDMSSEQWYELDVWKTR